MANELHEISSPLCGLIAVLLRFVVTSLTSVLAMFLLGKTPFVQSELAGLPTEKYHFAEMFFLPLFGIAICFPMASVVHMSIRLAEKENDFDQTHNIIGIGMLAPMPFLWIWDWTSIALDLYKMTIMAITHTVAQIWEATIEAIGFMLKGDCDL